MAIDTAAPVLRYGHARAQALGARNIRFVQMDAEDMSAFPDEHFDWVQTTMYLHELSGKSLPKILKEGVRVLAPGGLMFHLEQAQYSDEMPLYEQFIRDWDAFNNNEPFWRGSHLIDPFSDCVEAGFSKDKVFEILAPSAFEAKLSQRYTHVFQGGDFGGGGQWYVYGAWK